MTMSQTPMDTEETITAVATPPGRSALGMVRISGSQCGSIVEVMFAPRNGKGIRPYHPTVGRILLPEGKFIDEAVLTLYAAPHSYTREDLVEITCHGNPLILDHVVEQALACGARLARPGEFTYRAFLNGRIDLVQAAAVDDLISADSAYQAELALQHLEGRLSTRLAELREKFVELIALMEGNIDFSEEQHYTFITREEAERKHDHLLRELESVLGTFERGRMIREGVHVALVGRPNVGKSSIFNRLLGQNRAIVTPVPGTTRDYLQERITLGGALVILLDTAGIRESIEEVEKEGILRSRQVIEKADVILFVLDGASPLSQEDADLWREVSGKHVILLFNKSDVEGFAIRRFDHTTLAHDQGDTQKKTDEKTLVISAKSGAGMDELLRQLERLVDQKLKSGSNDYIISNFRHRQLLGLAAQALTRSKSSIQAGNSEELAVLDLHEAVKHIGEITGEVTLDDIYQEIFSRFCIGK